MGLSDGGLGHGAEPSRAVGSARLSEPAFWYRPDRDDVLASMRANEPVCWQEEPATAWSPGGRGYWAVLTHADVRSVSRNTRVFASGLGTELFDLPQEVAQTYSGMLDMDAPQHGRLRRIVSAALSGRLVARLEPVIRRAAVRIIDAVADRGECDFAADIADPLPVAVTCDLLGVPEEDRGEVARLSRLSVPLGDMENGSRDEALNAALDLIEYSRPLQRARRERPADDLITALVHAEIDGLPLTEDEAGTYFELLVTAGVETTGSALAHGMLALTRHPGQRRRWAGSYSGYAGSAIEEVLRWSTPVMHFRRTALADARIAGQPIAAGDKVVMFYVSANRDEAAFADPLRFDIARKANPHVTFGGGGPHFCLGAHLARLELRIMFEELFRRLPDLEIIGKAVPLRSMFLNGIVEMPCAFTPAAYSTR